MSRVRGDFYIFAFLTLKIRAFRRKIKNALKKAHHVEHHYERENCMIINPLTRPPKIDVLVHKFWVFFAYKIVSACNFLSQLQNKRNNGNQNGDQRKVDVQKKVLLEVNGSELRTHGIVAF